MSTRSAFSPEFESRSPFSPKYRNRKAFAKVLGCSYGMNNFGSKSYDDKREIYRDILERNKKLLVKIKSNMDAYKKHQDDLNVKAKAFKACDEKYQEMQVNVREIEISFDEFYDDERRQIVKDIQNAKEIVEILK